MVDVDVYMDTATLLRVATADVDVDTDMQGTTMMDVVVDAAPLLLVAMVEEIIL